MRRLNLRALVALLAAAGIAGSFAMLVLAAPTVAHRGAAASVYCLPGEKAKRKSALADAKRTAAAASASARASADALDRTRAALGKLVAAQKKARAAYFAAHPGAAARGAFVARQQKVRAKLAAAVAGAASASAAASTAADRAEAALRNAQAAYDQCA